MNLRRMTAADLPAVNELDRLSFSLPWPMGAFENELMNPNARCWVVELEEQVAAVLVLWRVLDEAHIGTVAVHPNFRRRGIGKRLLRKVMDESYAEGARMFHLEVRAGNAAAIALYEQFGFKEVNRRPRYYQNNGEDAVSMRLDLD